MKSKQSGFTLAEMAMVIAVLGVLSALILPSFDGMIASARKAQVKQLAHQLNQGAIAVNALAIGEAADDTGTIQYGDTAITLVNSYPSATNLDDLVGNDVENVLGGGDLIGTCGTANAMFQYNATDTFDLCVNGATATDCNVVYTPASSATVGPIITITLTGCESDVVTPTITVTDA
jgi:prepilin-type N-terminal cleavage/methylation domain-containing protein